jgi:hypothetical protein
MITSHRLSRLRYPLWRYVAIAAGSAPLAVAVSVTRLGLPLPLPPCQFQAHFGFPSPSCGLTRAFLAMARGHWGMAVQYHLFSPLILAGLVAVVGLAAWELRQRRSYAHLYDWFLKWHHLDLLAIAYGGYYGLRLWVRYTLVELPWGLDHTALWQGFAAGARAL